MFIVLRDCVFLIEWNRWKGWKNIDPQYLSILGSQYAAISIAPWAGYDLDIHKYRRSLWPFFHRFIMTCTLSVRGDLSGVIYAWWSMRVVLHRFHRVATSALIPDIAKICYNKNTDYSLHAWSMIVLFTQEKIDFDFVHQHRKYVFYLLYTRPT